MIISKFYCIQFKKLLQKFPKIQPKLVMKRSPVLLYIKTHRHFLKMVHQKLNKLGYEVLLRYLYFQDLAYIYFLFLKNLNGSLKDIFFNKNESV